MKLQKENAFTVFSSYQPTPHLPSLLIPSSFQLVFAPFRWKPHIETFGSGFLQWLRAQSAYMNVDTNLCSCESFEKVMANLVEKTLKKIFFVVFFLRICCFPWDIRMCVGWGLYFPLPETFETLNDIHTVETEGEKKSLPGTESWCLPSWCQASFSGAGYVRLVLYRITLPSAFF